MLLLRPAADADSGHGGNICIWRHNTRLQICCSCCTALALGVVLCVAVRYVYGIGGIPPLPPTTVITPAFDHVSAKFLALLCAMVRVSCSLTVSHVSSTHQIMLRWQPP